jgi:hypothetical protein
MAPIHVYGFVEGYSTDKIKIEIGIVLDAGIPVEN